MIYEAMHILFGVIFIWLSINITYLLIFSLAGKFARHLTYSTNPSKKRIAVLITSHREDAVIVNTVRDAVGHDYPRNLFRVFVAADHLQSLTVSQLRSLPADISEVNFAVGSKARSLNYLLNKIDESEFDIALVLDGDNIMQPGLLEKINDAFQKGFKSVQAHRAAKNLNTPVAKLDGISEEINNHLFRKAQRALGFSSSLIGSGMAFEFSTLKKIYNKPGILDNPACDREVDFELMKDCIAVDYIDDAIVYDEKVASKQVFEKQRRRWLESQIIHLKLFLNEKVSRKGKNYWNKLFITLIPPRVFFVGIFSIIILLCVLQHYTQLNITGIPSRWWLLLFASYVMSMLLSIPPRLFNRATLRAFFYLPSVLISFIKAAFTMKVNRKDFIHTPKTFTGKSETTEKAE